MKKFLMIVLPVVWLLLSNLSTLAQCTVPATPDETRQRIIDARPNRVFAAKGKTRFGDRGTIVIVNMNPFLFEGYNITIEEKEIEDQVLIKFIKALIPVAGPFAENALAAESARAEADQAVTDNNLQQLIARLTNNPTGFALPCAANDRPCLALEYMIGLKNELVTEQRTLTNYFTPGSATTYVTPAFTAAKNGYSQYGEVIFNRDTDTNGLCSAVNSLRTLLIVPNAYPTQDQVAQKETAIANMVSKARALNKAIELYNEQDDLKVKKWVGSTGFDYLADLALFAQELFGAVNTRLDGKRRALLAQVVQFDNMKTATTNLNGRETTLLQQEFKIGGKYDYSKVTVTVQPFGEKTPADPEGDGNIVRNGDAPAGNTTGGNGGPTSPPNTGTGTLPTESAGVSRNRFTEAGNGNGNGNGNDNGNGDGPPTTPPGPAKITDFVTTGKPRFEIGVGMAYSKVEKQKFQVVSGFVRDRSGNLTNGETFADVVGFSEETDHRLTPIALLHTRLTNNPKYNLYFSLGITGSRDQLGTNIEYLIGPSVNITDNIFITAGAFAARQHKLAGDDLFVDAGVPDGFDSIPVQSRYRWKPGISFSYRLPITGKSSKKSAAAEGAAALPTLTDTVYTGQPRFSISAGMAYSPLRQQSFQPIIGFARDRDGVLTSGETFTRIVGFNEDSDGRFLPMALLNTRIASNEDVGLHFSLGITAKRTDENTHVEYLIGPSFSFMKNQIVFTAGAYAGKQ